MILTTPRLTLRPARQDDLAPMHRVFTQPQAMRYWARPPHDSLDQTEAYLSRMILAANGARDFIVERDGEVIGKAGMWRVAEVGFILHPDHWGQGLAREALEAVIDHIFAATDLTDLTAEVDPRNAASLGLLGRLGFVETGRAEKTLLWGDEWCDSVYLALARADWVKPPGA